AGGEAGRLQGGVDGQEQGAADQEPDVPLDDAHPRRWLRLRLQRPARGQRRIALRRAGDGQGDVEGKEPDALVAAAGRWSFRVPGRGGLAGFVEGEPQEVRGDRERPASPNEQERRTRRELAPSSY